MEKVVAVCVAVGDPADDPRLGDDLVERAGALDPDRFPSVSVQVIDRDASEAWWGGSPPSTRLLAVLSAWTDCGDDSSDLVALVSDTCGAANTATSAVAVTETVPRWEAAPTAVLTALLHRRADMSHEQFVDHWRDGHQPLSFRIHPQCTYVRNDVSRRLVGAPSFDAICDEGVRDVEDILDPARFYGADGGDWKANRRIIGGDVPKFLDPATTASIMREHRFRDLPTSRR
jgi:hypothetical protein